MIRFFWNARPFVGSWDSLAAPGWKLVKVEGGILPSEPKWAFTGLRHATAAAKNMGIALEDPELWQQSLEWMNIGNRPTQVFGTLTATKMDCQDQALVVVGGPWQKGTDGTLPVVTPEFAGGPIVRANLLESRYGAFMTELLSAMVPLGLKMAGVQLFDVGLVVKDFEISRVPMVKVPARKKRFAGRTDLPHWREQHKILVAGRKFRRQQVIVTEDNQAGGRGRLGTGIKKVLAKVADNVTKKLIGVVAKHVGKAVEKKNGKLAGMAAKLGVKAGLKKAKKLAVKKFNSESEITEPGERRALADLRKVSAGIRRHYHRGLKPTVTSKRDADREGVKERHQKSLAAIKGTVENIKAQAELKRLVRRQKSRAAAENRKIMATRKRWLKHQAKIERERRQLARQVAKAVRDADKRALRKLTARKIKPCFPTQQRRRRRKRRLTSKGRASRR